LGQVRINSGWLEIGGHWSLTGDRVAGRFPMVNELAQ
jgi:hypothetical protein